MPVTKIRVSAPAPYKNPTVTKNSRTCLRKKICHFPVPSKVLTFEVALLLLKTLEALERMHIHKCLQLLLSQCVGVVC